MWLALRRAELLRADGTAAATGARSFDDYPNGWLTDRQLKPAYALTTDIRLFSMKRGDAVVTRAFA